MLVVEQQARVDVKNWEGWVPMIWAIVRGHFQIVQFLSDRVCPSNHLDLPWHASCHWDVPSVAVRWWAVLSAPAHPWCQVSAMQGSSLQWKSFIGWTPLHFAALQVWILSVQCKTMSA